MMILPDVLRENMDSWSYDDNGKMVPVKGASFKVIPAIKEMNKAEEEELESENGTIDLFKKDGAKKWTVSTIRTKQ